MRRTVPVLGVVATTTVMRCAGLCGLRVPSRGGLGGLDKGSARGVLLGPLVEDILLIPVIVLIIIIITDVVVTASR